MSDSDEDARALSLPLALAVIGVIVPELILTAVQLFKIIATDGGDGDGSGDDRDDLRR